MMVAAGGRESWWLPGCIERVGVPNPPGRTIGMTRTIGSRIA